MLNKGMHIMKNIEKIITPAMRCKYITGFSTLFDEEPRISLEDIIIKDPFRIFNEWYYAADDSADIVNPSIMCLATASKTGVPSIRYMLCESYDRHGFRFCTHSCSRKGVELESNPNAAVSFFWTPLLKAVRIEGPVEKLPPETCDNLFHTRPYPNQVDSHCSSQRDRIESVRVITERDKKIRDLYDPCKIPRPNHYCWYILKPKIMEFWQIHNGKERLRFRQPEKGEFPDKKLTHQGENGWLYEIMEP